MVKEFEDLSDKEIVKLINLKSEELSLLREEYLSRFKTLTCYLPGGTSDKNKLERYLKDFKVLMQWTGSQGTRGTTIVLVKPDKAEEVKQIIIDNFGENVFYR